ncbi:Prolyl oligopeptidase family protein [Vibrio ruber DSM 16370]|uniref:Prolyl oligopeptidase family protein n=1 Tax=Vibrio ruber (strain DSM 16370 / JCM 11486 / BCRC 17186 / CECT 7878 / LMG 23124 / VR1) TaxID=1123498 RepID=A0A1R4LRA2_VIBR1|nr:alpha/beta fold hydrolase [Vibrio ruber]SJN59106.1 Prolyl oligopeptidase family protein [Vibrio ruber DSM 16370]
MKATVSSWDSATTFFCTPLETMFRLSPNGQWLSYLHTDPDRHHIGLSRIDEHLNLEPQYDYPLRDDEYVLDVVWKTDEILIVTTMVCGAQHKQLHMIDITANRFTDLSGELAICELACMLPARPDEILTYDEDEQGLRVVSHLNLRTQERVTLLICQPDDTQLFFDWAGQLRLVLSASDSGYQIKKPIPQEGRFEVVGICPYDASFTPIFTDVDPDHDFFALTNIERDSLSLARVNIAQAMTIHWIETDADKDMTGITGVDPNGDIEGVVFATTPQQYHFFNADTDRLYQRIKARIGLPLCTMLAKSADGERFVFAGASDVQPEISYLYDATVDLLVVLGSAFPQLDPTTLATTQFYTVPSFDGLRIECYLTIPEVQTPRPLILFPHAGPWGHDRWGFNAIVQYFCAAGFAVLQMNFRGSTGSGRQFIQASIGHWEDDVQTDIEIALKHALQHDAIDSQHIHGFGISFGGYSVLMQLIRHAIPFTNAVIINAPSDMAYLLENMPKDWQPIQEAFYHLVHDPRIPTGQQALQQASPLHHCHRIHCPLMIVHSRQDRIVPVGQSETLAATMQAQNQSVTLHVIDDEGHEILKPQSLRRVMQQSLDFLLQPLLIQNS